MSDKNVPIDLSDLGAKLVAPAITAKPETSVDLSALYGDRGGLVVPPSENETSQPEQMSKPSAASVAGEETI